MMPDKEMLIDLAKDFSPYPSGRTKEDGDHNGALFRDEVLIPAIRNLQPDEILVVNIDGVRSFGSSFLEEAFAGLIRLGILNRKQATNIIQIQTSKPHLVFFRDAIMRLLRDAQPA